MTNEMNAKTKPKTKPVERIAIDDQLKEKLVQLTQQANDALQGMTSVSKSDVINFILKNHPSDFSKSELKDLRSEHFDEVKFSQWITTQLKDAKLNGTQISLKELVEQNFRLFDNNDNTSRRPRVGRLKKVAARHQAIEPNVSEQIDTTEV